MTSLPSVSGARVKRALERAGYVEVHTRGSHCKLRHQDTKVTVVVPMHARVRPGTLAQLLKDARITVEEFRELL